MGRILNTELTLPEQEFELTDKDFHFIQWFMHKHVGIFLSDQKRAMVYGRVSRQLRRLGLRRFREYRPLIENDRQERVTFINCLTTNKTSFFREYHHFEFLEQVLSRQWQEQGKKQVAVWSAGCSSGEEPYSIATSLAAFERKGQLDEVVIVATDLDTSVLEKAQLGIYSDEALNSIPKHYLKGNFVRGVGRQSGQIKVKQRLMDHVQFSPLNLLEAWPFTASFDVIFCRNVMIYFDKKTQARLLKRFYQQLSPDGVLFLGHSESLPDGVDCFHHLGHTIYVKK